MMNEQGAGRQVERACACAWAKADDPRVGAEAATWLPLDQHLADAADLAVLLFDVFVPESVHRLFAPLDRDEARRLVRFLAGVHDVGKATPAFAVQVCDLADRMVAAGLRMNAPMLRQDRSRLPHGLAGAGVLDRFLGSTALGLRRRDQLTAIVGGHHGTYPEGLAKFRRSPGLRGDGLWVAVQDLLVARACARAGIDADWPGWATLSWTPALGSLVTAVVVMADWIASGDGLPRLARDDVPALAETSTEPSARALAAWRQVRLPKPWRPHVTGTADERFADRFPRLGQARNVQRAVVELAQSMQAPGLMILEAPMGVGKTEAAFLAAEVLAERCGSAGIYVGLPTQATSDAMFTRMLRLLERLPDDGSTRQPVALLHGKAWLNEEYDGLWLGSRSDAERDPGAEDPRLIPSVAVWLSGRHKAALNPFAVGTIDQVLRAALRAKHVSLRQYALATKVVIVDEVHAADVFMSMFLDRALEWLAAQGAPVVLLSATLPAARRCELYAAYERGRLRRTGSTAEPDETSIRERIGVDVGYPSIVVTGDDGPVVATPPSGGPSRTVELRRLPDGLPALADLLSESLADGGCAVVVRNTVRRAQETGRFLADTLPERLGEVSVSVAHASFLAADRVRNDAELLRKFGPPGEETDRPRRSVVVATQVVEQSLDVDFDLMVTDLAPVDLVLQRIGRLHRHDRPDRPPGVRTARCYVTGVEDWAADPPRLVSGPVHVYGRWPLLRAVAVLAGHLDGRPVRLPDDISPLVQTAYGDDDLAPASWGSALADARRQYAEREATRQATADTMRLPPVGRGGANLYRLHRGDVGDALDDAPKSQAYVRDGADSIEVIVLQHRNGVDRIPDWVDGHEELPLRDADVPDDLARVLARCALRLPMMLTNEHEVGTVVHELEGTYFEGWQHSPLLHGQLALVLDDDRRTTLAGHRLTYDLTYGLLVDGDRVDQQAEATEPPHAGTGVPRSVERASVGSPRNSGTRRW